jgi:hypothetical protein
MQVNSEGAAAPANAGSKDEIRDGGADDAGAGTPARTGRKFRSALERRRPDAGTVAHDGASAAAMAGWFRPESGGAAPPRATGVAAASAPRPVDRILVGAGPDGAQARIRIGAGALAGTEIQLSTGAAGHAVEAQLLTHAASSRQTLSLVMDEIRLRLRDRGIVLATKGPAGRAAPAPHGDATQDDREAPTGSSW